MPQNSDKHHARLQHSPSAERNSAPILEVLRAYLPETGRALEIASGSGQHAAAFANAFPGIDWHPSDPDERARDSIAAWAEQAAAVDNLSPPLDIDVTRARWQEDVEGPLDAVLAINLVHIAPWEVTEGLLRGAGDLLVRGTPHHVDGKSVADVKK